MLRTLAFLAFLSCGPWTDVGCRARGPGLSWASYLGCLFLFGERLTKSLSSLVDAMTKFGLGTAFPLADPLACIYQQLHVSAMYASVVWTTLNCWVRGITVGAGLVVYVTLNSCCLLVALLVCNEKVLIYVSVKLSRILKII
jgi:hypothetical protein